MQPKTFSVKVGGYDIFGVDQGVGEPVLLLHGLVGDHKAWMPTINRLASKYRVIAPDNRGAGKSTQIDEPITFEDMAQDMIGVLDALDIDAAHVVGRSTGGGMAQHLALLAPARTKSLALLASFAKLSAMAELCGHNMRESLEWSGSWETFARHALPYFVTPEFMASNRERCRAIIKLIGSEDRLKGCYFRQGVANYEHDTLDRLHLIACPTLVAAGARDPLCGPISARAMAERIKGAELVIFENSSHFFLMEEEPRYLALIEDWLSRVGNAD